jgi:hypothetical protein
MPRSARNGRIPTGSSRAQKLEREMSNPSIAEARKFVSRLLCRRLRPSKPGRWLGSISTSQEPGHGGRSGHHLVRSGRDARPAPSPPSATAWWWAVTDDHRRSGEWKLIWDVFDHPQVAKIWKPLPNPFHQRGRDHTQGVAPRFPPAWGVSKDLCRLAAFGPRWSPRGLARQVQGSSCKPRRHLLPVS